MNNSALTVIPASSELQQPESIDTLVNSFISYISVKDITAKSYFVCLRCFCDWMHDNGITYPQRTDIIAYTRYLASPHPKRSRYETSSDEPSNVTMITMTADTQARYLRAVKLFFKWLAQEKIYDNVADNVKGAKVRLTVFKRDPLTENQSTTLLDSIDRTTVAGKRDYAMIHLGLFNGLRIIEMQRANIGNIELKDKDHVIYIHGKGHDEADTYMKLDPESYNAIMDYLSTRENTSPDSPLFTSTSNRNFEERLSEPSISSIIKNRMKDAGLDSHRLTAHSLRHTSATLLRKSGATLEEAQHHCRHSQPSTTEIYDHSLKLEEMNSAHQIWEYLNNKDNDPESQLLKLFHRMSSKKQKMLLSYAEALVE